MVGAGFDRFPAPAASRCRSGPRPSTSGSGQAAPVERRPGSLCGACAAVPAASRSPSASMTSIPSVTSASCRPWVAWPRLRSTLGKPTSRWPGRSSSKTTARWPRRSAMVSQRWSRWSRHRPPPSCRPAPTMRSGRSLSRRPGGRSASHLPWCTSSSTTSCRRCSTWCRWSTALLASSTTHPGGQIRDRCTGCSTAPTRSSG